jgi:transcriptional regulator with XRE-family HTH domain
LSQEALAEQMGISRKQIADYEASRTHMNDEMIVRFARALNVSADSILGLEDTRMVVEPVPLKLTRRLRDLEKIPEQKRKAILKTLDDLIRANS